MSVVFHMVQITDLKCQIEQIRSKQKIFRHFKLLMADGDLKLKHNKLNPAIWLQSKEWSTGVDPTNAFTANRQHVMKESFLGWVFMWPFNAVWDGIIDWSSEASHTLTVNTRLL